MKIIVYCPWPYDERSGGVMALHKFADNLSKVEDLQAYEEFREVKNIDVFILTSEKKPGYGGTQLLSEKDCIPILSAHPETIVVYPEVVNRNPLDAKNVIRYILNSPGLHRNGVGGELSDENTYSATDKYLMYDDIFKVAHPERIIGKVATLEPHLDIFKITNQGERKESCYLVRKGYYKEQNWHKPDAIKVDDLVGDFQKLADVFNRCETFISYDHHCFATTQAALCGCLVIVVPDSSISAEQWYNGLPTHKWGQAYGMEGIDHAIATLMGVRVQVQWAVHEANFRQTRFFVNFCQNWLREEAERV